MQALIQSPVGRDGVHTAMTDSCDVNFDESI